MNKPIIKNKAGVEIPYTFKELTYRQFQRAVALGEEVRERETADDKVARQENAIRALVDVSDALFEEASNKDVQRVLKAAIEYNMLDEEDLKKSA